MHVVADPEIVGVAELGRYGIEVDGLVGREIGLVGLQERAAHAPHHVALGPVLLGLDALEDDARAGRDRLDLDASLLAEGLEGEIVERVVVRRVDDDLLFCARARRARRNGECEGRERPLDELPDCHAILPLALRPLSGSVLSRRATTGLRAFVRRWPRA